MMATRPALPYRPAARGPGPSTQRSFPIRKAAQATIGASLSILRPYCRSHRSVDLAGRSVALSSNIPAIFDAPLGRHHMLIGGWVASHERSVGHFTRPQARRHIERTFDAAVRTILDPVDLADLHVTVLRGDDQVPPALAIMCSSVGQLDLGWIEDGDAPMSWRATAYDALARMLDRVLPVFGYENLLDTIALYYWEGQTDDEAARRTLIEYHGADEKDLASMPLPSTMDARRPEWMIAANKAPRRDLPPELLQRMASLREAHGALVSIPPEHGAWHVDHDILCGHIPEMEERSHLPSLTLVPFEQFACELDDIARHSMEVGFMDVAGLLPLPDASRIDDWFASLRLGARFLCAAQDLIRFDPSKP